jgi:[ribosomal protein S18]-alanine N-acetyltransferase
VAQVAPIERTVFSDPWSERDLHDCVSTGVPFLVAEQGGAVIGYVIARHALDEAEILNLGVVPTRQRQGVGRALVQGMLGQLRQWGVATVFLEVRESNSAARQLYGALGFAQVGRRRNYYRLPTEDAVVLRAAI